MFKFIKKYAETMDHISIYPVIGLVLFFSFFIGVIWYVKTINKTEVSELKNLPLE
ncbi:MAG: hypothetical protein ACOVP6_06855 [Lacibacter sp.]|jgi:cytochrome c oxidase cbb3-type subunit IV